MAVAKERIRQIILQNNSTAFQMFIRKQEIIRIYESSIIFDTIAPNQGGIVLNGKL